MRRGDIVRAAGKGDFSGKPRPSLVVQSDKFNEYHSAIALCPLTSIITGDEMFRVAISPTAQNGLKLPSEIQVDKVQSVKRRHIVDVIGRAGSAEMEKVDAILKMWFEL